MVGTGCMSPGSVVALAEELVVVDTEYMEQELVEGLAVADMEYTAVAMAAVVAVVVVAVAVDTECKELAEVVAVVEVVVAERVVAVVAADKDRTKKVAEPAVAVGLVAGQVLAEEPVVAQLVCCTNLTVAAFDQPVVHMFSMADYQLNLFKIVKILINVWLN